MILHPTDDEFLHQAELCRTIAAHAPTEELKMGWLRLAGEWQSMIAPHAPAPATSPFDFAADKGSPAEIPPSR